MILGLDGLFINVNHEPQQSVYGAGREDYAR